MLDTARSYSKECLIVFAAGPDARIARTEATIGKDIAIRVS